MYKDREKYLEYQRQYYQRKKQLKHNHIKTIISFEEKTIKKNIEVEKRRKYYYNKRYDKLNPSIVKKEKELFLII